VSCVCLTSFTNDDKFVLNTVDCAVANVVNYRIVDKTILCPTNRLVFAAFYFSHADGRS